MHPELKCTFSRDKIYCVIVIDAKLPCIYSHDQSNSRLCANDLCLIIIIEPGKYFVTNLKRLADFSLYQ